MKNQTSLSRILSAAIASVLLASFDIAGSATTVEEPQKFSTSYSTKIAARIKRNTRFVSLVAIPGNPTIEYELELFSDGHIKHFKVIRSSGYSAFDEACERAAYSTAPIERDPDTGKIPRSITIRQRLKDNDNQESFSLQDMNPSYLPGNQKPEYPKASLRSGEEGTVILRVLIQADGTAGRIEIANTSGFPRLDESAIKAVKTWKFRPATKKGAVIAKTMEIPVTFRQPIEELVSQAKPPVSGEYAQTEEQKEIQEKQRIEAKVNPPAIDSSKFIWPTEGKVIRSFDASRKGIDIAGQPGQPIVAVGEGTVLYANNMRGFGNLVIIDHRDGLVSAYGHNKNIMVKEGQTVTKGQRIAEMGDVDAESVRLHFEIRQLGKPIDPLSFLPSNQNSNIASNADRTDIERERQQFAEERRRLEQEKREREQQRQSQRVNLQVTQTQPAADGSITITVQTNADTASLLINGEEQGGRISGYYIIKKVARAGQETKFTVTATDINGNKDTKVITVTRQVVESAIKYAQLNPAQVKKQPERDAVAVIIGISKYESLPIAEFANDDARAFYDYAIRGLGVKPENIKLLVDEGAREAEILKTFRTWLPSRVKSSTEVFVFYSGHGLPTPDGSGLYLLPLQADREVIDDTAIPFAKINDAISMTKPKSVTVILDACYSGQTKAGQTLVASARPIALKAQNSFFPSNFTVISASQSDQISSSSPDLQHGIFSYYLMKGMEGDADINKDGKITLGEMLDYLVEQVGRQAAMMSRKQEPQLIGDVGRVLVGK